MPGLAKMIGLKSK